MKKTIMAIAAALMMSATAMAQQDSVRDSRQQDPVEMTKQRTDQMVKDYGLSEEQAQQLFDLNTKFADKLPPMMMGRGPRAEMRGQRPEGGQRPQAGERERRPMRPENGDSLRRGGRRGMGGGRQMMNFEEMRKNMDAYNAELEKIMTEEQYAKYKEAQQQRMQRMQRRPGDGPRGQRPQRSE